MQKERCNRCGRGMGRNHFCPGERAKLELEAKRNKAAAALAAQQARWGRYVRRQCKLTLGRRRAPNHSVRKVAFLHRKLIDPAVATA